ncbi:hypothetical protein LSPH24S_06466 [Lysinibacillus sphaericus]
MKLFPNNFGSSPLFPLLFLLFHLSASFTYLVYPVIMATFWNTKVLILPGAEVIRKGPYTFMRHPNYAVVSLEILLLPIMFQAYFTAFCFTLLNITMLSVRIPIEEQALRDATDYNHVFKKDTTTKVMW